ncbi:hypothetical protein [Entomospira culicis]|uniref:Uncharacterized protein n=1 Tax=Entomospira culicis TaxID=2719989 RepID=A0A968KWQ2_9SPIO|nr:hypothetical protein [Entomospira culicis]NIZ19593.1 hypothetical protein [Entomospira culicis]NIZ69502.1 hypothetical protein [Entomospira culicis]WDI36617.1 hypothetical protein PVA46_04640 [Entomospira culicis]WDI38245.1 hypothetical protein PVA47_04650 [Entomospira culicis]
MSEKYEITINNFPPFELENCHGIVSNQLTGYIDLSKIFQATVGSLSSYKASGKSFNLILTIFDSTGLKTSEQTFRNAMISKVEAINTNSVEITFNV